MANRVKGITIEINGDTTGLSKSLSGINKEINSTKSELKDIERLLKLDPSNVELLEQKQKNLAKQIDLTSQKLKALKEAEKQAQMQFEKGDISEQQYNALKREIIATETSLNRLEESAKESGDAIENASKNGAKALKELKENAEKSESAIGKIGSKANEAGQKLKTLSAAGAVVAAGVGALAVNSAKSADELNTLAKQTGMSAESLQKFAYATDLIDVEQETLVDALKNVTQRMGEVKAESKEVTETFKKLGVRVTDSGGKLRDSESVFYDTIDALSKIKNTTERDALAMKVFGESAQRLNPLIMGGADALKKMGDEAERAGLIMSQDTLDAANKFNDELDVMKAKAKASFGALGAELAIELLPLMEKLSDVLSVVLGWISKIDPSVLVVIAGVASLIAVISPLLILIGQTVTAIQTINTAMVALAGNPTVLMVAAIAAIVAGLIWLEKETQIFSKTFTAIWEGVQKVIEKISNFFIKIFTEKIPNALKKMQDFFKGVWESLVNIVKAPANLIISMINGIIKSLNKFMSWANNLRLPKLLGGGSLGFNFKMIDEIPLLAKGGILSQGSAIVGERGAEMLTVKNGKAIVQPLGGSTAHSAAGNNFYFNVNANDIQSVADFWRVTQSAKRLGRMM